MATKITAAKAATTKQSATKAIAGKTVANKAATKIVTKLATKAVTKTVTAKSMGAKVISAKAISAKAASAKLINKDELVYSHPTMCLHCHLIVEMFHERGADPVRGSWQCPRCNHKYLFSHWKIKRQTRGKTEAA